MRGPQAPSGPPHQASGSPCPGDLTISSRSSDLIVGEPATCPHPNSDPQEAGDLHPGTKVESPSVSSEPTVPSGPCSRDRAPGSQTNSPAVSSDIKVSTLSRSESTVPGQLCPGAYMVALSTSDSGVPSEFRSSESISPSEKSFAQRRSITGPQTVPTPRSCGFHEGALLGDTWRTKMESLMSKTLNARLPRPHGPCAQSMNGASHNPARSVSLGACVRGRCEGLGCMAAPPMSPMPPSKAQCHQDSSMISLKNLSTPRPQLRCHMRSRSDLPAPHTFSDSQETRLPSVDLCVSHSPVQWNSSPRFSSTRFPVAGGVAGIDRSSPSPVSCPTPSVVSAGCASHPPNADVAEAARSECVASCVQWIHDQVPPWPTTRTPRVRTLSAVQRDAIFKGEVLPTTTPERHAVEPRERWYNDCTGSGRQVRRRDEDTVTTNNNYSPTPDTREHCCQRQAFSSTISLPSVSSRATVSSPKFKVKFVKGMSPNVTNQSAPQVLKAASYKIPEGTNTIPQECSTSITF